MTCDKRFRHCRNVCPDFHFEPRKNIYNKDKKYNRILKLN